MLFRIQIKIESGETYTVIAKDAGSAWQQEKVKRQQLVGHNDIVSVDTLEVVK